MFNNSHNKQHVGWSKTNFKMPATVYKSLKPWRFLCSLGEYSCIFWLDLKDCQSSYY